MSDTFGLDQIVYAFNRVDVHGTYSGAFLAIHDRDHGITTKWVNNPLADFQAMAGWVTVRTVEDHAERLLVINTHSMTANDINVRKKPDRQGSFLDFFGEETQAWGSPLSVSEINQQLQQAATRPAEQRRFTISNKQLVPA
ncbi:MAG: hypothetical protein EB059_06825 [Alphaproteobacteria bacterium]|nr:hypothetical protein [Alphaproteobacteria bacterium]